MNDDQAVFVDAAKAFEQICYSKGFEAFLDALLDELATGASFAQGQVRPNWTLGEEFAFRLGINDAAFRIVGDRAREDPDGLRERILKRAQEILKNDDPTKEVGNGEEEKVNFV